MDYRDYGMSGLWLRRSRVCGAGKVTKLAMTPGRAEPRAQSSQQGELLCSVTRIAVIYLAV